MSECLSKQTKIKIRRTSGIVLPHIENKEKNIDEILNSIKNNEIKYEVEFVLTEDHPLYSIPPEKEQYCYRKGVLLFKGVSSVIWGDRSDKHFVDKNDD